MEHVVFFPAPDGAPAFRRVPDLEQAVRLVEHLRNVEGVNEVSCHALTEVPLAFRAYYRVEVPAAADHAAVPAVVEVPAQPVVEEVPAVEPQAAAELAPAPEPAVEDAPQLAQEPVLAGSNGHAHDGAKSLGFFA